MSADERLLALVRALAAELKPGAGDFSAFGADHHLERDFGLDSLARVELVARIERVMGHRLGEAAFAAETPADLQQLIDTAGPAASTVAAAGPSVPPPPFVPPPSELTTLIDVLEWHVRHQPERIHLHLLNEETVTEPVTYRRLAAESQAVAAGLLARGAPPGSRIALMLPTGLEFFAAFYGAIYAGCVPVPLYPPARPAQLEEHLRRIAGILANAGARWLIADPRARTFAQALSAKCPDLSGIVTVADLTIPGAPLPVPARTADDLAFIQYTSGSTGNPKGVALTHGNLLANLRAMRSAVRATHDDVFVSWLPLYHDMGLIGAGMGSLVIGFPLVLMSPLAFLTRPVRWLEAIARHRGTLSAAPNFAYELCAGKLADGDLAGLDLSSWRLAANGAEAISVQTMERFAARLAACGLRREALAPVYGLAECSVGLAFPPPGRGMRVDRVARRVLAEDGRAQLVGDAAVDVRLVAGCGHALPGHDLRIVGASGRALAERRVGRIQFRGPSATRGYFENPSASASLFDGDWLNTGDLGYLADGELFVTGREKDLIIRAGHNVYPQELEEAVGRIDGVRAGNVAVFPATDRQLGTERLVVLAETREVAAEHARIRAQIEQFAVDLTGLPADDVVLAPPGTVLKTSSGKLRRAACRAAYEGGELLRRPRSARRQMLALGLAALRTRLRGGLRGFAGVLWSLWAWTVFALLAPPFWLAVIVAPTVRHRRAVARVGARLALTAAGVAPRIEGLEHLPDDAPAVIVANHASYLDGMLLTAALPARFAFVAKQELLTHPLSATPLRRLGAAFVERFDTSRSVEDTQAIESRLAAGDSLVFFAEGTFARAPGLLPFRMGAFVLAARTGSAVVPVTLRGTRGLLPDSSRWPRFSALAVIVHAPIRPAGADWDAALALRDGARQVILAHLGEADAGI